MIVIGSYNIIVIVQLLIEEDHFGNQGSYSPQDVAVVTLITNIITLSRTGVS